jgi:hypothetical protein
MYLTNTHVWSLAVRPRAPPAPASPATPLAPPRREAALLTERVLATATAFAAGEARPAPHAELCGYGACGDPRFLLTTESGARVTPNLAQAFLLLYCARLPGADRCVRGVANGWLPGERRCCHSPGDTIKKDSTRTLCQDNGAAAALRL